jgi:hypothetical protein
MSVNTRVTSILCLLCLAAIPAQAEIVWHWQDRFDAGERQKLTEWIRLTVSGVEKSVTTYPFDVHIFFHRRQRAGEPVPWAHTERSGIQGVRFHVDPDYPLDDLLADWTAAHELSHLTIPSLNRKYAWFAEGFASYMQYQVMHVMNILSKTEMERKYQAHITRADKRYRFHKLPFIDAAGKLRNRREYATMYWGGAVYFLQIDQALKTKGGSLAETIKIYMQCCRNRKTNFQQLINELDRLSSGNIFSNQLQLMKTVPGFPVYDNLF